VTPFVQHTFVQQFPIVQQFFDEFMFRGNNELIRKIFNSKIGKNEQKWFFQKWIFNSRGPIVLLKDGLVLDAKFSIVIGRGN